MQGQQESYDVSKQRDKNGDTQKEYREVVNVAIGGKSY